MAIKINFDTCHNVEAPTFVLAKRNGDKYGILQNVRNIVIRDSMKDSPEVSFAVCKENNGVICNYWDEINDFKLVWCREWDTWFEITVSTSDSNETYKNVSLKRLGEAELSNIMLYGVEINTENDILRDDYTEPTVLYHSAKPEISLLNRILEKAPHYSIRHVDPSIADIQRTFTFDNESINNALDKIAEEINCFFVLSSGSKEDGTIHRCIDAYDLYSCCKDCGARGEFNEKCPECGSSNISAGYGEDTTILVSKECLGEDITLETDTEAVKNCYRLKAGDDLMTAAVINCNPNGSAYIWNISSATKSDMPDSLVKKINSYEELYHYYQSTYTSVIPSPLLTKYNNLLSKYKSYRNAFEPISSVTGYPKLMEAYYNTIDLELFLKSGLMPDVSLSDTSAKAQAALLTGSALSPVAIANMNYLSLSSASASVLNMARVIIDGRYQVKVKTSSLNGTVWTGNFIISNYSDEDDMAESSLISVTITNNYSSYIKQKINKSLNKGASNFAGDISAIFSLGLNAFKAELKKYCLDSLNTFHDSCQSCINVMSEQGIDQPAHELYRTLYIPYTDRLAAIQAEMLIRENEIAIISAPYNASAGIGMQDFLWNIRTNIQNELNLQKYLGDDWRLFCSYRREETYSNDNYISDGLNNAELFKRAYEFIQTAENEIYKSANLQHKISAKMKNLLSIKEFEPLVEHFSCGNRIRVQIEDKLYLLRLLDYEIDFNNLSDISVTFSDVIQISNGISNIAAVINKSCVIVDSYNSTLNKINKDFEYTYDHYSSTVNGYFNSTYDDYLYQIMDMGHQTCSKIEQTDAKISLQVAALDEGLSARITMTENSISHEVSRATAAEGNLSSRIYQNAQQIALKVDTNGIIQAINLSPEGVLIKGSKLSLEGHTTINGGFQIDKNGNALLGDGDSWVRLTNGGLTIRGVKDEAHRSVFHPSTWYVANTTRGMNVLTWVGNDVSLYGNIVNADRISTKLINDSAPVTASNFNEYLDTYIENYTSGYLPLSGGRLTGALYLPGNPTSSVDQRIAFLKGEINSIWSDTKNIWSQINSLSSRISSLESAG